MAFDERFLEKLNTQLVDTETLKDFTKAAVSFKIMMYQDITLNELILKLS